MKLAYAFKWLALFILVSLMGTFAYGDTSSLPDPLELVSGSKYYGQMTKAQATEIIEKCAGKMYQTQSIVKEDKFFMGVPAQIYSHSSGIRTTTKFKWADVKHIQLLQKSIKLTYESSFFGTKTERALELAPETHDLADLALAVITLTGLPLSMEKAVPEAAAEVEQENPSLPGGQTTSTGNKIGADQRISSRKADVDLEESLIKLKDLYNKGLISEAVYESKQKELLDSMLGK